MALRIKELVKGDTMMTRASQILLLGIALSGAGAVEAIDVSTIPNAGEMQRLPPYCVVKYTSSMNSPEYKAWSARIGQNYVDIRHYCSGINFINRYWAARTANERTYYLNNAMGEFNYMVGAEKPDFALRAELYSYRGEVFRLMGKFGEAINDLTKALTIDPKAARPYEQLADLYVKSKNPVRALEITTEGLRHLPDSKALRRRYDELGGKKPYPEPYVAQTEEPAQQPASPAADDAKSLPAAAIGGADGREASGTQESPSIRHDASPAASSEGRQNPWCRFCPDEPGSPQAAPSQTKPAVPK